MDAQPKHDTNVSLLIPRYLQTRYVGRLSQFAIALCCLLAMALVQAEESYYQIAPTPDWVKPLPFAELSIDSANSQGGHSIDYWLLDRQWDMRSAEKRKFSRFLSKAITATGVEEAAHIAIDFDPAFEMLTLHNIVVHRDGKALDRIARSQLSVIQRETDLGYRIYNGTKTLNIFIEDVRRGDVVEYSYTLAGSNPVMNGHFAEVLSLQWGVSLKRYSYRLLWPSEKPLYIKPYNTSLKPAYETHGEYEEYVWQGDNVDALRTDSNVPAWYDPFPSVHLSDMGSWSKVAAWALPLYAETGSDPQIDALVDEISAKTTTKEERFLEALHFVQEEVRYLGIEMGPRSHQPNLPQIVLEQRFGDCKDKSRLLVALLHKLDIEAYPALVHSSSGRRLLGWAPTPLAFDHVIVQVVIGGQRYWVDPTRSYQAGGLKSLYQPDYEYALVVTPTTAELTPLAADLTSRNTKVVDEVFDLSDDYSLAGDYTVNTQYNRAYADQYREQFAETDHRKIQDDYVNYTAQYYPGATADELFTLTDDTANNRFQIVERYRIPEIWQEQSESDGGKLMAGFAPFLITDHVQPVSTAKRTMPYSLAHPVSIRHTTKILLPPGGNFDDEHHLIEDAAFRFVKDVHFENNTVTIDYRYDSLRDYVTPQEIDAFAEHIQNVRELAEYSIEKPKPLPRELAHALNGAQREKQVWQAAGQAMMSVLKLIGF